MTTTEDLTMPTTQPHKELTMTPEIESLRHDLIRKVPEMLRGFSISTNYGEIEITPEDARDFHDFTKKFFEEKIKTKLSLEHVQA